MVWKVLGFVVLGVIVVWLAWMLLGVVLKLLWWLFVLAVLGGVGYGAWRLIRRAGTPG